MKKLLVALVATTMTLSAFAADGQNMVRFMGLEQDEATARSVDLSMSSDDADDENSETHIALNYARAFGQWQVGVMYRSLSTEAGDVKNGGSTIGLSGYYNFDEDLSNSCFLALHLRRHSVNDADSTGYMGLGEDDTAQDVILEYGHRFHVAEAWGFHVSYAPSVMYSMRSIDYDADNTTAAETETALAWNWLQFDLMF